MLVVLVVLALAIIAVLIAFALRGTGELDDFIDREELSGEREILPEPGESVLCSDAPDDRDREPEQPRYASRRSLLTRAELAFFRVLEDSLRETGWFLAIKPRLADLVQVDSNEEFWKAFRQISQKHVDFAILDRQQMRILVVVELDDRTHREAHRRRRDAFVDQVLSEAGIPIIHQPWQRHYSSEDLRKALDAAIFGSQEASLAS